MDRSSTTPARQPRLASRVRLARPELWRDAATGRLAPDVRDAYLGIGTMADSAGWLPWDHGAVAANLYPYTAAARRERDLARRVDALVAADLIVVHDCGCAELPRLPDDMLQRGGEHTTATRDYHQRHHPSATYVALRRPTDESARGLDWSGLEGTGPVAPSALPDGPAGAPDQAGKRPRTGRTPDVGPTRLADELQRHGWQPPTGRKADA